MGKSPSTLPLAGHNSCVPPPPGFGRTLYVHFSFFFLPHNSLSLPSLSHHTSATAAVAFTSHYLLASDRQACNDCHIRLTPVTSASESSCCR